MHENSQAQIISTYEAAANALSALCLHIRTELKNLPLWVIDGEVFNADRNKLIDALNNFGPTPGLMPQETFSCPGAVACTLKTLGLIEQVNTAKTAFKTQIALCKQQTRHDISKVIRHALAQAGYTAVKLKQVYRHIPFIAYHPRRIAWARGKHNSSQNLSKVEVEKRLIKIGQGAHIDIQLAKLAMLDCATSLVIHRDIKACWMVNIATFKQEGHSLNEDIKTSLPVFYLHDEQLTEPTVCFSVKNTRGSKARSDKKIEAVAFLPSLSAYRKFT